MSGTNELIVLNIEIDREKFPMLVEYAGKAPKNLEKLECWANSLSDNLTDEEAEQILYTPGRLFKEQLVTTIFTVFLLTNVFLLGKISKYLYIVYIQIKTMEAG